MLVFFEKYQQREMTLLIVLLCPSSDDGGRNSLCSSGDEILVEYIKKNGHGSWRSLPNHAGLIFPTFFHFLCH
uniref:Uncharacterized protein n=1 Tax=Nelumbo nucifera TaxID=4432 RepID=A0A822Y2A6_NELNU|nr:TPA_asm: hypothetical protein HUJ06_028045 [Nelumbo nucifera]